MIHSGVPVNIDEQATRCDRGRSLDDEETCLALLYNTYTIFLFQDGSNDVVVDTAHQYQVTSFVQVDAYVSFSFAIPVISLKKQVNRAFEEGISEDENMVSVSKVKQFLSLYPLIALF